MEPIYFEKNIWLYHGDNVEIMKNIPEESIDLTITSPPYDNIRVYTKESEWNLNKFLEVAKELFRITKNGGTVVWIVNDQTLNGSETGSSFTQALKFIEIGFNLHDTMIYDKGFSKFPDKTRYGQSFEYMFILTKGKIKTFNPIKCECKEFKKGVKQKIITDRNKEGNLQEKTVKINEFKTERNVWLIDSGFNRSTTDKIAFNHPAIFPEKLANDHILSWSNENDLIFDPFNGSGTTAKMCKILKRKFVGIDISKEYIDIAIQRIKQTKKPEIWTTENCIAVIGD